MFGLQHCTAYACCMNGYNSLVESDAAPLAFCPECDAKVWWRFHLDPVKRYANLSKFATERGLSRDADLWARCGDAMTRDAKTVMP
jgi:archaemetzincin